MPAATHLKRLLFGRPLASDRLESERLDKKTALAVLSSDAISSVAYSTDQILFVLSGVIGVAAVSYVLPISAVIVGLLVLVGLSYRQTIFAYPGGGGSYTVAKHNLGGGRWCMRRPSRKTCAVYIEVDPLNTTRMRMQWEAWDIGVDLVVLPSPYRSVLRPLVDYVNRIQRDGTTDLITVVVPEVVPHRRWEHLLHNKTALFIRTAFLFRANVIVTNVPFLLGRAVRFGEYLDRDERLGEESVTREMEIGAPS